ncbi:T-cell activation Rho GTPase-activating protein-like [Struthio camelus]|uniref:T-cell activation Rho GTPase-activating protein-like n=1 Tax=Struthio camelus TaxID=8801 RepID=UPI003603E6B0
MGQAHCCGARGAPGPAPGTPGSPGDRGHVAPGARVGLVGGGASRRPAPLGAFVSRRSPQLLLSDRAQVTRHQRTRDRHLLLLADAIAIATFKWGSTFLLKHRVPLSELWVLCGEDEAACGRAEQEEEEEEVFGLKCANTLILVWPSDLCVVTFRQSPGAPEPRLTRLTSLRLLVKAVGFHGPRGSLSARTVEALISAEAGPTQDPLLVPAAPAEGLCRSPADGPRKRKRLIRWPFARRRTSANGDGPGQPEAGLKSPLFGQPLARLCGEEESLPQPVQDLLAILYREGPATEGVFRKAASERARRDLKEALDKGAAVELESQPVHLLAVVLKDFLRSIPCTLLSAALYEKWMLALDRPSREGKIEELKEVADQLPRANVLLLRPLLAVLRHISQSAETNRMHSSNLAICVGPNMLSPGTDSTLPLQVQLEMNNKVTLLVEFLIDNCTAIFGEDLAFPGSPTAEECPEQPGSSAAHRGAAQEDAPAHHSPEPEAGCHPPTSERQQPSGRSPTGSRTHATCLSAPPLLPPRKNDRHRMGRSSSEPALSFQERSEGSSRHQKRSRSADSVGVGQQQLCLEHEALEKEPAVSPAQVSSGAPPQTSSRHSLESCLPASHGRSLTCLGPAAIPSRCWRATRTL